MLGPLNCSASFRNVSQDIFLVCIALGVDPGFSDSRGAILPDVGCDSTWGVTLRVDCGLFPLFL